MYKKFKLDPTGSAVPDMIMQVKDESGASINPKYIPFDESNTDMMGDDANFPTNFSTTQ